MVSLIDQLNTLNKKYYFWIGLIFMSVFFIFFCGGLPGVTHDSVMYFQSADYLVQGSGYLAKHYGELKPATHFPPLYSISLAGVRLLTDCSNNLAALIINYLSWMTCTGMLMMLFIRNQINPLFTMICLLPQGVSHVFMMAWSEPLFMALSMVGIYFLLLHISSTKIFPLILSAIFLGISALARYNGIAWFPLAIWLLLIPRESAGAKIKKLVPFLLISLIPISIWFIRNYQLAGSLFGRESQVNDHHIPTGFFKTGLETIGGWIYPGWFGLGSMMGTVILMILLSYSILVFKSNPKETQIPRCYIWVTLIFLQFILVIYTVMFADKTTMLDQRILNFAALAFVILMVFFWHDIHRYLDHFSPKIIKVIQVLMVVCFTSEGLQSFRSLNDHRRHSSDLTSVDLPAQNPMISYINLIQDTLPILSYQHDDVYLSYLTNKHVRYLNDLYNMPVGQVLYMAFYNEQNQLPETGYKYLNVDTIVPGHLYKMEIK